MVNKYSRYQKGLKMVTLFPINSNGLCSCGCGKQLNGRKRKWYSQECSKYALNIFYIIKGDNLIIRQNIFNRDNGYCSGCGEFDENWQADHITPVFLGGGACTLDNFQTLCKACHREKTFVLDRIPDSCDVFTTSFNVLPASHNASRTINYRISKNII